MAFFDIEQGAQKEILFGCTVQSINADLGFGTKDSAVTVTVVEEPDQTFSLNRAITANKGIKSVTSINIGEFNFVGIVQSWEQTVISPNGSGIFKVKLTDARPVLDDTKMLLCAGEAWGSTDDPNSPLGGSRRTITGGGAVFAGPIIEGVPVDPSAPQDQETSTGTTTGGGQASLPINYGNGVIGIRPSNPEDCSTHGLQYDPIQQAINNAEIEFGSTKFKIDMTEVTDIINSRSGSDDSDSIYRVPGETQSISELIARIARDFSFDWYIEISQSNGTNIIKIKVVDRSADAVPSELTMDKLIELHGSDRVIRRIDGFENKSGLAARTVVHGGHRQVLREYEGTTLNPFWGFEPGSGKNLSPNTIQAFVPLSTPKYHIPGDPPTVLNDTTESQMRSALAGTLNNTMPAEQLNALKAFAKEHWGKKFYLPINSSDLDTTGEPFVDIALAGWWEDDNRPDNVDENEDFLQKFSFDDGRWLGFVRLPFIDQIIVGVGDDNSNITGIWDTIMNRSENVVFHTDSTGKRQIYMKIDVERINKFWIITLPDPMIIIRSVGGKSRLTDFDTGALWLPELDFRKFYGPWASDDTIEESKRPIGRTETRVDRNLVPWTIGTRGITHTEGMEAMNHLAYSKVAKFQSQDGRADVGQLEVADLPRVNLGAAFGQGSNITKVSITFTISGVTTVYTVRLFTEEISKKTNKLEKEIQALKDKIEEIPPVPDLKSLWDAIKALAAGKDPDPTDIDTPDDEERVEDPDDVDDPEIPDDEPETLPELSPVPETFYLYDKPEGGLGVITGQESSGPFYTIRRLNHRDINPATFAGGLNIDNTYFLSEWKNVRNLAEDVDSPGFLPVGTRVTVSIFAESESGPHTPFIEQTPPVFAPPVEE